VRRAFERRFTVETMARAYLEIYHGLPGTRMGALASGPTTSGPTNGLPEVESNVILLEPEGRRGIQFA